MVIEPTTGNNGEAIKMSYVVGSEEASKDVANKTTNSMFSKDIKSIIDAENELELGSIVGT